MSADKLAVSKFTLGTVQLGMKYGLVGSNEMPTMETSFGILGTAWHGGVSTYDTAAMYGESERVVGRFFSDVEPDAEPIIITKVYVRPKEDWGYEHIEEDIRRQTLESLEKLGLKRLSVMMLHNADAMREHGDAIVKAFAQLVQDGLVERAGISFSTNTADEFAMLRPYLEGNAFDVVQLPLNLFDHRPIESGCLELLSSTGKTVFVRSVFLQGILYANEADLPPQLPEALDPIRQLRELADSCGLSAAQLAVSYIRDMPGVDSLVIGVQTAEQLEENLRLMEGPPIPDSIRSEIRDRFRVLPERLITPTLWK